MFIQKNDEIELIITDINEDGAGIGKYDGFVFFVPNTVPGDHIRARVLKLKKSYGYGKLIGVTEPSPDRIDPVCPVSDKCGGCSLMSLSYEAELKLKETKVKQALLRIGGFPEREIQKALSNIIEMENPSHYRNKAQYPVAQGKDGNIFMGFYAPYSHRIIESPKCAIGQQQDRMIINVIREWMVENHVKPYDETKHKGLMRHVLIRHGRTSGQIMVCFVVNDTKGDMWERQKALNELYDSLMAFPGMTGICVNLNPRRGNVIMGEHSITCRGAGYITDSLMGYDFKISPTSFYQVNPVQTEKLYGKVLEYAQFSGKETVWDLYCGIGTITLAMASKAKRVLGIEASEAAVRDATENEKRNSIDNVKFIAGNTEDIFRRQMTPAGYAAPDIVVLDPPRKGCDPGVLSTILEAHPKRIVYVSCNPSTLARDLKILSEGGYRPEKITPVDQFPRTMHVETVVLMEEEK